MAKLRTICFNGDCSDIPIYSAGSNIDITNDVISADLTSYYDKDEVDQLLDAISTGQFLVVQELPQTGEDKTIYLVPNGGSDPNIYDEYIYINNAWEKIGSTEIDLNNYYDKDEVDGLLDTKQNTLTAGDNVDITNDVISATDTTYNNATTSTPGLMSAEDKAKLDALEDVEPATANPLMDGTAAVGSSVKYAREDHVHPSDTSKQDVLTAGSHIEIAQDGTISATNMTKQEILTALGMEEIVLSKTDENNNTVTVHILGYVEE